MMASIHEEYSLITLEPPFIPDKRSRPTRSLIVIFSTLIGGLIGIAWVLVRHFTSGKE
jgi:LPS O-antigen subunit length determinant protein (WzzB/FepE family)